MIDFSKHQKWADAYSVEKAIEVVVSMQGDPQTIRVEALRSFQTGRYSTRAYCQQHLTLQSIPPHDHEEAPEATPAEAAAQPITVQLWVDLRPTLQLTNETSADAALERALGFLAQRCD